ncbi:PEP-CTERM sorting domain-containing protein [Rheinheimera maricola]|uniref:PEP-CTERM sorting domain-containing protein n=1 Tax=Rheinheimera maricola TaxID=2793282 RepID=A0ABS7X8T1_9GAMM|nr:PEP-CTERM sorting domain-containing protein [Rheinheimera maricola]
MTINIGNITSVADVPEPSTLAIFALTLVGLASRRFKKKF